MNAPDTSKSPASTSGGSTQNGSFYVRPRTKIWTVVICFILMIGASVVAMLQPLKLDPQEPGLGAWFWHPIETNPYARLPYVNCANEYACRLNSVAVSDQGEVWAVGNVGLVLHRAAGQTQWEQLTITATQENAPSPARPTPTPSSNRSTAVPTPPYGTKPVPDLRGMSETGAAAEAEKAGFKIEFLDRPATRQILQVIDQSPAPGTMTMPGTLIRVKLALPKAGARLMDKLIPTVYAAAPEPLERKKPQVARPDSETRQPPPQQQQQQPPQVAAQQQQQATAQQQSSQSQQPIPILTVTPTRGAAPLSVSLRASTLPPNKNILVMFSFGDGAVSDFYSVPDTTYTYKAAGTYRITATFREHGTDFASTSVAVIVEPERALTSILPLREDDLIFVTCSDKDGCRALGRSGRVYTVSGASQWKFRQAGFVLQPGDGLIPSSAILKSTFDGKIYASLPDRFYDCNQQPPRPIFSANPVFGCFLGFNSTNGSVHEPPVTHGLPGNLPTKAEIHGESFLFSSSGLVAGDDGIILSTSDGGKTWRHETQGPEGAKPNHRLPAPWYWGLAIGLIVACTVVVALPVEPAKAEDSIADWAVTDAPLKPGDTDSLDFMPMALGLSRFIRNAKTQPPVTIAIEGEWGSGKSSVMSLLRGDLEKSRYRPVWFNAWHHQSEEQLLAALLEHIKGQAIPPWWHIDNWIFRARLVYNRFHRKWPLLIVLVFLFSAATTYEFSHHPVTELIDAPENLIPFRKYIPSFSESKTAIPTPASPALPDAKSCAPGANCNQSDLGHLGLLLSLLAILGAILRAAKTFGIDSAKLTDNLRNASTIKDLKPDPAIRSQFAREFGDFCKAWEWGSRRVILFIDDLDRCRPESVVTVLESINFLTTSGNCMIVLGIAQDQVTHAVGLGFKEIAEAEAAYDGTANNEQEKAAARFKYGRLYIKKLVNIVAPLPKTTIEQRRRVLEARAIEARRQEQQQKAADPVSWRMRLWDGLSESGLLVRKIAPVAGLVLAVILSAWSGYQIEAPVPQPMPNPSAPQPGPTPEPERQQTQTASKPDNAKAKAGAAQPLVYDRPTTQMANLRAGQNSASGFWRSMGLAGLFLMVLFGILGYQLSARTNQDAQNSPEFEKSLEIWGPYIVGICDTPREIKRALNDLRYQAMTRRSSGPNITRGDRLIRAMRLIVTGKREEQPVETRVNEAALPPRMAAELAGLTEKELKFFLNPQVQYTGFTDSGFPKSDTAYSENLNRLVDLKAKHIAQFGEWLGTKIETTSASAKSAGQNS